jgi:PAS domain-containing protein
MHTQIERLNISLQKKISDLDEANIKITLSEEKYRRLIEGSDDIIFSLDHDWRFLTVSKSIKKHLYFNPDDLISKKFFEVLHDGRNAGSIPHPFIQEKLDEFSTTKKPVQFKAEFKSLETGEPTKMHVRLEYIDIEGKNEILGKASRKMEDSLLKYFISEYQKFDIGNYLITAEEISYRITRNLERYIDQKEVNMIRVALREIIINSIEHGNLNISFDEKTEMMKNNKFFEIIGKKQNDPVYINKRVRIEYSLDPDKVIYKISDEGKGFDYEKILNIDIDATNSSFLEHGRGIIMATSTFDEIKYTNNGKSVILKKTITANI